MSANAQVPRPLIPNRRRRVRQKVHAPAYATFIGPSKGEMVELNEVLDISEVGVAIQCPSQLEENQNLDLCLDLAEAPGQIFCSARVVWSDSRGRTGLALAPLKTPDVHLMREWLFLNAMAGAANAASSGREPLAFESAPRLNHTANYSDTLNAAMAVQREAETLGSDIEAVLALIATRSQSLLRASGAAIALAGKDRGTMICRASAGDCAPPTGAKLQVGSGFSGECVRSGTVLRCDDAGLDERVDPESCRALNIRSMLAAPIRQTDNVIGIIEIFSPDANAFTEKDGSILQRFAEIIASAIKRSETENPPAEEAARPFTPSPGSVLFAQMPEKTNKNDRDEEKEASAIDDQDKVAGIRLPRAHLYLLMSTAAAIALALGFILAPWIQEKIQARGRGNHTEDTVLASSGTVVAAAQASAAPTVDSATLEQLRDMAERGDAAAEDRLGRLYAEGDESQGIVADDKAAAHWFTSAAEHGSVSAQYKLGLLYWGGHHGLPKDASKAYFWTVIARAGGQEGSKDLATFLANSMTRAQAAAIEQQADSWYREHESPAKPSPGH